MTLNIQDRVDAFLDPILTPATASELMSGLTASAEPAVVLSSLARSCVPEFSDACTVELSEGVETAFRVTFPPVEDQRWKVATTQAALIVPVARGVGSSVCTPFHGSAVLGHESFAGIVVHFWHHRRPSNDDSVIARILVDHAISITYSKRLEEVAALADERARKLALEVIDSRIIGEAMGILMNQYEIAEDAAMGLLRHTIRETGNSMSQVCTDLVRDVATGISPLPSQRTGLGRTFGDGIGRGDLYSVSGGTR